MPSINYEYKKSHLTDTLDQYIACQSDTSFCYNNLSFIDRNGNIDYNTYNVVRDYIDELRDEYCKTVILTDEQVFKYKYKPKLLCFDIYGNGELAFLILLINDMYNAKQFTKNKLLMPTKAVMAEITKYIYNSNKNSIADYNDKTT